MKLFPIILAAAILMIQLAAAQNETDFNETFVNETLANLPSLPFFLQKVLVDGIEATEEKVRIETGKTLPIEVWIKGNSSKSRDLKVEAWIGGYEYYQIRNATEMFDIEKNVVYKETLELNIPSDLILGDRNYTLFIRAYDKTDKIEKTFKLFAEEKRHSIKITDVIFRPGNIVEAGKNLFVQLRLENAGKVDEEDIKILVSIPKLGISAREYLDELPSRDTDSKKDSATTNYAALKIYEDAPSGSYELITRVEYNKGYSYVEEKKMILIKNELETQTKIIDPSLISIEQNKKVEQGQQGQYKILITNIGDIAKTYTVNASKKGDWGNISLSLTTITVTPGNAEEIQIIVLPKESGQHQFHVQIKNEKGELVRDEEITVNADKIILSEDYDLKVVFLGLIGVLVVLAVLVGLKNLIVED
ncbi:hypothetical protein HY643_04205 [Candidatus Woesearchaeota archaeon]|nr:hypothetical protein [Candidatus Woesearchaeota archaeon]